MITISRLDASEARTVVDGAKQKAMEIGVPVCIAVVDEAGFPIAFHRMDGGKIHSIQVAFDKAFTASSARRATHEIAELAQPGQPLFGINAAISGRFSIIGGGVPVIIDGAVVGGVGVSSGTPAQDLECAIAGMESLMQYRARAR